MMKYKKVTRVSQSLERFVPVKSIRREIVQGGISVLKAVDLSRRAWIPCQTTDKKAGLGLRSMLENEALSS